MGEKGVSTSAISFSVSSAAAEKAVDDASSVVDTSSALSRLFFGYCFEPFRYCLDKGTETKLGDIPRCSASDNPHLHANRLRELLKTSDSAVGAYLRFIRPTLGMGVLLSFVNMIFVFLQPIANKEIVAILQKHAAGEPYNVIDAYYWAVVSGGCILLMAISGQHATMWGKYAARRSYAAFCQLTFEKPSRVTAASLGKIAEGEVMNMMSVDCLSICNVTLFLQFAAMSVMLIVAASVQIVIELGVIGLPAIAGLLVASWFNKMIGDKAKTLTLLKNKVSDARNVKLNETLQGMRTIKLNAWETVLEDAVSAIRKEEETHLKHLAWWNALLSFLLMSLPQMLVCGTLLFYVYEPVQ